MGTGPAAPLPGTGIGIYYNSASTPLDMQYNLNIQRDPTKGMILTVGYTGSRGMHLLLPRDFNTPQLINGTWGVAGPNGTTTPNARLNPNFAGFVMRNTVGNSNYNGLIVSFNRRFANRWQTQVSYTYSKSLDDGSAGQGAEAGPNAPNYPSNPYNAAVDYGRSSFDRTQAARSSTIYELPGHGLLRGGWRLTGLYTRTTGAPFTPFAGFDRSGLGGGADARPNLVPGASPDPILGGPNQYFNPAAFSLQPVGTLGNLGRGTVCGPGYCNLDAAIFKNTRVRRISEVFNVPFRAEFFNLPNHPNWGQPNQNVFINGLGTNGTLNPNVGRITRIIGTSRQIGLGIRIGNVRTNENQRATGRREVMFDRKRNKRLRAFALIGLAFALAAGVSGHHSSTAYDLSKRIEWKVTVTQFQFVNPHSYVFFTMQDTSGRTIQGRCELPAVTALARVGWTRTTLIPGQKVTIKGSPGRNEENVCYMVSFVGEDGREVGRSEDFTKGGPNPLATLTSANQTGTRPARLPNGHPNLNGPWVAVGAEGRGGRGPGGFPPGEGKKGPPPAGRGPGRGGPPRPEETEAGVAAAKNYDQPFDDPAIKCDPANILFGWVHDSHVNEIAQKDDEIDLMYGYMDFPRTIHMNQAEHPKNVKPSRAGHSIGKWEGDVLVVDTVGFLPGVLIPIIGVMHSGQMHVAERFTFDPAAKTLTREYRADDPLYLKNPHVGRDVMMISNEPHVPYNCVELSGKNNIRSKDKANN
jgi:hypothetical protein